MSGPQSVTSDLIDPLTTTRGLLGLDAEDSTSADAHWAMTGPANGVQLIKDRGDAPAQAVLDRNLKAQASRRAEETKYELNKINARVDQAVTAFELGHHFQEDDKAAYFVPDLMELEKVVGDAIQKHKYQRHVMIFVVGFEEAMEQKTKLLNQINDFFTVYINTIAEKQLEPELSEVDLDQVSTSVQEALATADQATQKLSEINHEIVTYVEKLHNGKALTKSKKKLERALSQAKEDIMSLSEKLMGAQAEIEDKEDQMTKLYKQIDIKNMETLKHKAAAENARKKLAEIDDLNSLVGERDAEIERLKKAAFEHELTIQQITQSRELSYTKLKGTQKDSEENIEKLQSKVQSLQLLLEDTKADLQKQHRIQLTELKKDHQGELETAQKQLQEKVDQLESDAALARKKDWASDSDEEADTGSKPASSRLTRSRKSVKNAPSRQSTQISLLPGTPKTSSGGSKDDPDSSSASTPKRLATKKSVLEPLPEVPYEGPVTLEDEDKWCSIPQQVIPSAFKQYRKEAVLVVKGLQKELQTRDEDYVKEVTQMTEQIRETEEAYKREKSELLKQVDTSKHLKEEAEKEADKALAQLETFVAEHGELVENTEPKKKELKKLTKEQREKYMRNDSREGKRNVKGKKTTKKQTQIKARDAPAQRKKSSTQPPPGEKQMVEMEEVTGAEDVQEHVKGGEERDDKTQDGALEANLQLDGREKKTSVDRWQQTSRPESEAHQALYNRLMSMGKMQPAPPPIVAQSPSSASPSDNPEDITDNESSSSVEEWQFSESVIKKPLFDSSTSRRKHHRQRIAVRHQSVQCSPPIGGRKETNSLAISNSKNQSEICGIGGTGVDSIDGMSSSRLEGGRGDYFIDNDNDTDMVEKEAMARHLKRILDSSQWSNGEEEDADTRDDENGPGGDRPTSALSQRSLYERFKAQLEQTKQEVTERRSRATSMHGSLIGGGSSHGSSRVGSAVMAGTPGENGLSEAKTNIVIRTDIGTSPFLLTPESGNSRKSSISASDNPIVLHLRKTYDHVRDFKLVLSQAFADKDLGPASERLHQLRPVEFREDEDLNVQMNEMTSSVQLILQEISAVVSDYLNEEPEAAVSSVITSHLDTGRSGLRTAPSVGVQTRLTGYPDTPPQTAPAELLSQPPEKPTPAFPAEPSEREGFAAEERLEYKRLREDYNRLQEDSDKVQDEANKLRGDIAIQKQMYEGQLEEDTLNIAELEATVHQLQLELTRRDMTPSIKPTSSAFGAPSGTFNGSLPDPLVVFTRTDTERNQKVLKRGINSNRVTPNQYNEVVRSMERYNAVPAKRLVHIVQKYTHHAQMKRIEGNIKKSNSIDDDVFALLKKMEALQNKRAEKWGEQMDNLMDERTKLAQQLMESLTRIEEESGIFLIKPILSWRGSGFPPYFESKQSTYKPPKTYLRPVTREGSVIYGPAPTPTPTHINRRVISQVEVSEGVRSPFIDGTTPINQAPNHVHGSAVHLLGTPPQGMWSMTNSLPTGSGDTRTPNTLITTPKILELEVNRLMIGQNNISSPSKPFLSGDRLVNAANSSVRSYVTVARQSTYPMPSLKPQRPSSTGAEYQKANTAVPISRQPSLTGLHVRPKSESALNVNQPLPPIKVPREEQIIGLSQDAEYPATKAVAEEYMRGDERERSTLHIDSPSASVAQETEGGMSPLSIREEDASKPVMHPSPPHTPPGSSLRHSPAVGAISVSDVHLEQPVG